MLLQGGDSVLLVKRHGAGTRGAIVAVRARSGRAIVMLKLRGIPVLHRESEVEGDLHSFAKRVAAVQIDSELLRLRLVVVLALLVDVASRGTLVRRGIGVHEAFEFAPQLVN